MVYINTSVIILVLKVLYTNIHGTWNRLVSKAWGKKEEACMINEIVQISALNFF
jgi:hypothetical protein